MGQGLNDGVRLISPDSDEVASVIRLNVSRSIRSVEHHDIAGKQEPLLTITDLG